MEKLKFKGEFFVEIIRDNLLIEYNVKNKITESAINSILLNYFDNGSPSGNLYIGLGVFSTGNIYSPSINNLEDLFLNCIEFDSYIGNRKLFIPSVNNGEVSNISNKVSFNITQDGYIPIIFLTDIEDKNIKIGNLISRAIYQNGPFGVKLNDIINISYKITTFSS